MSPQRQLTAAIYVRVSTDEQSHDMQTTDLQRYAGAQGWAVVEYKEKESSVRRRPVLDQMMRDAIARKVDVVLVWKLDRFARSLRQLIDNIAQLDAAGVRFMAITQAIDTSKQNPAGRMMMQLLGVFAEFERSLIVERVRAGMAEAIRQGKHCGRPKRIWDRDRAVSLRKKGLSFRQIAAKLQLPEPSVRRAIKGASKA